MVACARARARLYQGFQRNTVSVVKDIECHVLFKEIALSPFNLDRSRFNETEVYRGEDMNVESPDRSRETGGGGRTEGGQEAAECFVLCVNFYSRSFCTVCALLGSVDFSCIPESRSDRSERSTERPPPPEYTRVFRACFGDKLTLFALTAILTPSTRPPGLT